MKTMTSAVAATLLILGLSQFQFAQSTRADDRSGGVTGPESSAMTRFSRDGAAFIEAVRAARRAIFDGDPATAKALMRSARSSLEAAKKDAPSFTVKTTTLVQGKAVGHEATTSTSTLIPVDGQVVIADDYVQRPDKQTHIDKANEHFKKGEAKQAVEKLRLARIDVGVTRVWAPLLSSEARLSDAIDLADSGKYYQSNLLLKAIEDGLTTDSMALLEPAAPPSRDK